MWNLFPQCIQHHFHLQLLLLLPLLFLLLLILLLQLRQYPYLHWGNECCASRSSWFLIVSWLRPPIVVGSFKGGQATETQTQPMKKDSKKKFQDSRLRLPKCPPFICEWHSTDSRAKETGMRLVSWDALCHHLAPFRSTKRAAAWQTSWENFPQSLPANNNSSELPPSSNTSRGRWPPTANYFHKLSSSRQLII